MESALGAAAEMQLGSETARRCPVLRKARHVVVNEPIQDYTAPCIAQSQIRAFCCRFDRLFLNLTRCAGGFRIP